MRRLPVVVLLGLSGCFSPKVAPEVEGGSDTDMATGSSSTDPTSSATMTGSGTTEGPETSASTTSTDPSTTGSSGGGEGEAADGSETGGDPVCGNAEVEDGEECDAGEPTSYCSAAWTECTGVTNPNPLIDQALGVCIAADGCEDNWITREGLTTAQAFVVSQPGRLVDIELHLRNTASDTSELTLELVDGGANPLLPTGLTAQELDDYVIGSASVVGQEGEAQWETFDFSDQDIDLDSESNYFIWLRMHPPFPADNGRGLWSTYATVPGLEDPYPAGRQFFCLGNGGECQANPLSFDGVFRVRIDPPPPICEG